MICTCKRYVNTWGEEVFVEDGRCPKHRGQREAEQQQPLGFVRWFRYRAARRSLRREHRAALRRTLEQIRELPELTRPGQ